METDGNIIIPIIDYVIGALSPIIGLIYGAILVFFKKESALYQKHGRFIIYFSIVMFVIYFILFFLLNII